MAQLDGSMICNKKKIKKLKKSIDKEKKEC